MLGGPGIEFKINESLFKHKPDRTASTLLPIIQAHVATGTSVQSDEWSAYNAVGDLPAVAAHNTVNHSINFVDPSTGVHIQHIESYWNRAKLKIRE